MHKITPYHLAFLQGVENPPLHRHPHNDIWPINDSTFTHYSDRANIYGLPNVAETVRGQLGKFTTNVVGLDLAGGANGIALQELLDDGTLSQGIMTNLQDNRSDQTRQRTDLEHINGDLIKPATWQQITEKTLALTEGKGLSLVMHRPCGALQQLPTSFYDGALHLALDLLRPGGVLFSQIPFRLIDKSAEDLQYVCDNLAERKDINAIRISKFISLNSSVLIIKNSNSCQRQTAHI